MMLTTFNRYLFKQLFWATLFITIVLTLVILLTQSLRFLELVIESSASSSTFFTLTFFAMPRFLEIIVPIALLAAILFIYNKLTLESEITVMRASGSSPMDLAKPALVLALICSFFMFFITMWAAPTALSNMQKLRQVVKAQYSTALFREGVFNTLKNGLTVYIKNRNGSEMYGLFIHDARPVNENPVLITAHKGIAQATQNGQRILIYDGTRQSLDKDSGILSRLDFKQYSLDIPDTTGPISKRWREPDERTFAELFHPDTKNSADVRNMREFTVEIHRRITNPLLVFSFAVVGLGALILGPVNRRGQGKRIVMAIGLIIVLQSLYLATFNLAKQSNFGLFVMYLVVLAPFCFGFLMLSSKGDPLRSYLFRRLSKKKAVGFVRGVS